jgi:hypothetical protein
MKKIDKVMRLHRICYPRRPLTKEIHDEMLKAMKLFREGKNSEAGGVSAKVFLSICNYYEKKIERIRVELGYKEKLEKLAEK